jgi:hypothetical protein
MIGLASGGGTLVLGRALGAGGGIFNEVAAFPLRRTLSEGHTKAGLIFEPQ